MSDAETLALELARAQLTEVHIVSGLVVRCGLSRDEAISLCHTLADRLADAALEGQIEAHEKLRDMMRAGIVKGLPAVLEFGRQFCGWGREGITAEARQSMAITTRAKYGSSRARSVA